MPRKCKTPEELEARRAAARARYAADPDRKAKAAAYYQANKERHHARQKLWNAKNADKIKASNKRSRERHKERRVEQHRAWSLANPGYFRQNERRRAGGVDPPRESRSGVCPICTKDSKLVWDHCHVSGKTRGWLCGNCNRGLGQLGDNLEGLHRAVAYLIASETYEG